MNKDYKNIDELVSKNLNSFEMDFDDGAWADMETMLDKQPKGFWQRFEKNKGIHLLAIGFLGTLTCCWAWWFFVQQPIADNIPQTPVIQQAAITTPAIPKAIQSIIFTPEETVEEVNKDLKQHVLSPAAASVKAAEVKGHTISVPKLEINKPSISTVVHQDNKSSLIKESQTTESPTVEETGALKQDIENAKPIINKYKTINTQEELDQKPNKIKSLSEYESEVVWLEKTPDNTTASILTRSNEPSIDGLSPFSSKIPSLTQANLEGELASVEIPFNKKTPFRISVKGIVGANTNFTDKFNTNKNERDFTADANIRSNGNLSGTTVGIGVSVGTGNHWSVETAFLSSKRNYISMDVISPEYIWGEVSGIEYNINAWEIPLLFQYDFGGKAIRPFIAVGPSIYRVKTEQYVFHSARTTEQFLNNYSGSSASRFESRENPISSAEYLPTADNSLSNGIGEMELDDNIEVAFLPAGNVRTFLGGIFNVKAGANWRISEKHSLSLSALYQTTLNEKRFELALSDHEVRNFKYLQSLGLEVGWSYRLK